MSMVNDIRRQMVIAFHEIPGIGWRAISKALAAGLWRHEHLSQKSLLSIGFKQSQAEAAVGRFERRPLHSAEQTSKALTKAGAVIITRFDEEYPPWLKQMSQPPWVLYAKGRLELLQQPSISIVGTRAPTAGGRHSAERLAEELSSRGLVVVSGLARGIDSRAHEAALRGRGSTIAVLPTPIDSCYPPENRSLFGRIGEEGLLLSEMPIGTKLHPGQFPLRNRIIAGLSVGTIVVEGAARSGSLITADQALEMNREVFAVPGPINSPKSEGPNGLIKRGEAKLITCANDVIEELAWLPQALNNEQNAVVQRAGGTVSNIDPLSSEERKIIHILQDQPLSINEIHELTFIPFGHLNALLLNLCIKRKIELQPGSIYMVL